MGEPHLLHCPKCKQNGEINTSLGSITSEGYLIIMQKHARQTMIMADAYSVICTCGYYIRIESGKIKSELLSTLPNG